MPLHGEVMQFEINGRNVSIIRFDSHSLLLDKFKNPYKRDDTILVATFPSWSPQHLLVSSIFFICFILIYAILLQHLVHFVTDHITLSLTNFKLFLTSKSFIIDVISPGLIFDNRLEWLLEIKDINDKALITDKYNHSIDS